jgi:hypothetical protein
VSKGGRSVFIQGRYRPGMEKVNRINQYEVFGRDSLRRSAFSGPTADRRPVRRGDRRGSVKRGTTAAPADHVRQAPEWRQCYRFSLVNLPPFNEKSASIPVLSNT